MSEVFLLPATTQQYDYTARVLQAGELVVFPTDPVYGIASRPDCAAAVDRLLTAKGRGPQLPPPVLVSDISQARLLAADLSELALALMHRFWPGGLTLVVEARPGAVAFNLDSTGQTLALRQPGGVVHELLERVGPLATTSANLHGQPPAVEVETAREYFGAKVGVYFDGGPVEQAIPSTIVDVSGPVPRVLRVGALSVQSIEKVVGRVEQ